MIKLTYSIFMSFNNCLIIFFYIYKICKDSSDFLEEKKEKSNNMVVVVNNTKTYQKMKSKGLLSIEKNILKREKTRFYCLYFYIQFNYYSKNYILLLVYNILLLRSPNISNYSAFNCLIFFFNLK